MLIIKKRLLSIVLALMILVNGAFGFGMSVAANTADGIYTEEGENYTSLRNMEASTPFYSQSVVVTGKIDGGRYTYVSSSSGDPVNTGTKSAVITVPQKDSAMSVTLKAFDNKFSADTKYVQFWFKNTSGNNVYISNLKFVKSSTLQYNLKTGADVQLIDETQKIVVNAARWSLVNTGNEANNAKALKIPADFTGYVRIPVSADTIDVKYPSSAAFDANLFAQASEISFSLGNLGDGGEIFIDDIGYVTGGAAAKAGAAFADLSQQMVYTDPVTGKTMAYRLYVPQGYDFITKYPVVLYLHGNGFQGDDNLSHITGDIGEPLDELVSLGNRGNYPCIIIAPQCPTDDFWVNTTFANGSYSVDTVAQTDAMSMALDLLADVQEQYSVDTNRIYAMGVSMGAFGCWDIMVRHPGVLDAAVPMMGAGDPINASLIGNTAIWAFHGAEDTVVPLETATPQMVTALQAIDGTNVKYTEYADHAHDTYRFAVCEEELLPWLFSQGDIYVNDLNEEYNVITGFEITDTATTSGGALSTIEKNTGAKSWSCTSGDNTGAVQMKLTFGETYPLSTAKYVQLWINNTSSSEQYLTNLSFQRSGVLQYNVPVGAYSILIDENTMTETAVQWKTRAVGGLGSSLRTLAIPAGFSGYVRISVAADDLAPTNGTYDAEKFDTANIIGFYVGNSSTGGTVYVDDFGYVTDLVVEPDVFANDINLPINSFEESREFSALLGSTYVTSTVKADGNFSVKNNEGTYYSNPVIQNANQTANADSADYLQFYINNASDIDQYIFNFNMSVDSSNTTRFRLTQNTNVFLIDDNGTSSQVTWTASGVSGASTLQAFCVPAGFKGTVRIDLAESGLEVREGTYSKENIGKIRFYNFFVGNRTATASTVIFDDFEFVDVIEELPTVLGAQIRTEDNNLRFVMMHNKSVIEALEAEYAKVEYGTVVVNAAAFDKTKELLVTDKTTGFGSGNPTTLANKSAFTPEGYDEFYEDYRVYSFVIKGVTDARKDTPIAVRAYIKVTDNDGNEHIIYGYDKYMHDGYQTTYNAVLAETESVLNK